MRKAVSLALTVLAIAAAGAAWHVAGYPGAGAMRAGLATPAEPAAIANDDAPPAISKVEATAPAKPGEPIAAGVTPSAPDAGPGARTAQSESSDPAPDANAMPPPAGAGETAAGGEAALPTGAVPTPDAPHSAPAAAAPDQPAAGAAPATAPVSAAPPAPRATQIEPIVPPVKRVVPKTPAPAAATTPAKPAGKKPADKTPGAAKKSAGKAAVRSSP